MPACSASSKALSFANVTWSSEHQRDDGSCDHASRHKASLTVGQLRLCEEVFRCMLSMMLSIHVSIHMTTVSATSDVNLASRAEE